MKNSQDVRAEFINDFKTFLKKYEATIKVNTESKQNVKMMVYIPSQYNGDEKIVEYTDIDLGTSFPFCL